MTGGRAWVQPADQQAGGPWGQAAEAHEQRGRLLAQHAPESRAMSAPPTHWQADPQLQALLQQAADPSTPSTLLPTDQQQWLQAQLEGKRRQLAQQRQEQEQWAAAAGQLLRRGDSAGQNQAWQCAPQQPPQQPWQASTVAQPQQQPLQQQRQQGSAGSMGDSQSLEAYIQGLQSEIAQLEQEGRVWEQRQLALQREHERQLAEQRARWEREAAARQAQWEEQRRQEQEAWEAQRRQQQQAWEAQQRLAQQQQQQQGLWQEQLRQQLVAQQAQQAPDMTRLSAPARLELPQDTRLLPGRAPPCADAAGLPHNAFEQQQQQQQQRPAGQPLAWQAAQGPTTAAHRQAWWGGAAAASAAAGDQSSQSSQPQRHGSARLQQQLRQQQAEQQQWVVAAQQMLAQSGQVQAPPRWS